MTTQNTVFSGLPNGLTLTNKLFTLADPDVVAYTSDSTVNRTNATDEYVFAFGENVAISGVFTSKVFLGSRVLATGKRTFAGTDGETAIVTPEAAALDSATIGSIADGVWDEVLTRATHNIPASAGRRLRQINAFQQTDGLVADADATTTTFITDLDSSVDNFYNDSMIVFTDGALAGQVRPITDYVGLTKTIVVEEALTSAPVNGVAFTIVSLHIHPVSQIQAGLATSAVLAEVKAQTDLIGSAAGATTVLAAAVLTPGTITEFPDTLTIGDSYTTANGRSIQIPIVDTDGNQISSTGSLDFADATVTFVIKRAKETDSTRIITGTASFTDPVGTGTSGAPYAVVQLTSSETAKGLIGYKYSGVLTFTWPYVGTGTDPEVMSFETDTLIFDN